MTRSRGIGWKAVTDAGAHNGTRRTYRASQSQRSTSRGLFLQGTATVISADGTSKTFHAGDKSSATKETTHWHRNDGQENAVLIAVDIFNTAK